MEERMVIFDGPDMTSPPDEPTPLEMDGYDADEDDSSVDADEEGIKEEEEGVDGGGSDEDEDEDGEGEEEGEDYEEEGGEDGEEGVEENVQEAPDGEVDPHWYEYGAHVGFTKEKVDALAKSGMLDDVLGSMARDDLARAQQAQYEAAMAASQQPPGEEEPPEDELDPDLYDPKVAEVLRKSKERVDAMQAQVEQITNHFNMQRQMEFERNFDTVIESMPEYSDILGVGPGRSLAPNSHAMQSRMAVLGAIESLTQSYAGAGMPVPPLSEMTRRAVVMAFGSAVVEKAAIRKVKTELSKRVASGSVSRTTQRRAPQKYGEKAAIAAVDALLKRKIR